VLNEMIVSLQYKDILSIKLESSSLCNFNILKMSESTISTTVTSNSYNECINWIEEAIAKKYFKYYEYNHFNNIEKIGSGGFGTVYRAKWKNSHSYLALKSFFNLNVTIKEIVNEVIIT
jgi:hypothetical protein